MPYETVPQVCSNDLAYKLCPLATAPLKLDELALSFWVTRDQEHVALRLIAPAGELDLGHRLHNFFLLLLARQRIEDSAAGVPESSAGWLYAEDLARDPSLAPGRLALVIFRIRKQFAERGIVDADRIIERRRDSKQIRIGIDRAMIHAL